MLKKLNKYFMTLVIAILFPLISIVTTNATSINYDINAWSTDTNQIPNINLDTVTSTSYNGFVYTVGPMYGNVTYTYFAKLNPNGGTNGWSQTSSINQYLYGSTLSAYNGYLYIIGGSDSVGNFSNQVFEAKINSDGTLSQWQLDSSTLPGSVINASSIAIGDTLYVVGGQTAYLSGQLGQNTIYEASINQDGSLGNFSTDPITLPTALASASLVSYLNKLYVIGGVDENGTFLNTIFYSSINSNGTLSQWHTSIVNLPLTLQTPSSVVVGSELYVIGGANIDTLSGAFSRTTYFTSFNSDGSLNNFSTSSNLLPQGLNDGGLVYYDGWLNYFSGYYFLQLDPNSVYTYYTSINLPPTPVIIPAASTTTPTTSNSTTPTAPDTGFGISQSNPLQTLSIFTLVAFLIFDYSQKLRFSNN